MAERGLHNMVARESKEDEKELLFFISDEFERDEDAEVVDPCHQNLLRLLDRLLLVTAMFITVVIGTSITIAIIYSHPGSFHPHSIDTTLKSNAPSLHGSQTRNKIKETIVIQSDHLDWEWNEIILCSNLQRKSVLNIFQKSLNTPQ